MIWILDIALRWVTELDFLFSSSRIRIHDFENKAEIYKVKENKIYKDYKSLVINSNKETDIKKYSFFMCDYIEKILNNNEINFSSLKNDSNKNKLINLITNSYYE